MITIGLLFFCIAGSLAAAQAPAEPTAAPAAQRQSLFDFIKAGGWVGYVIILLSVGSVALTIDGFLRVRPDKLIPPELIAQLEQLSRQGKFNELLLITRGNTSMLGRIVGAGMSRGDMGLPAIREGLQENGTKEITRLHHRIGYIGLASTMAPMLGLLGTVTGMIGSFNVLGMSKGAARPDELASGIAEALVTTCMGLIVALPLAFCHTYLRDQVTRTGQELSGVCERLLRSMAVALETRMATRSANAQPELARQA
jgi:biopolymer transport protein ExbB